MFKKKNKQDISPVFISVIIALRNESENLPQLIQSLASQTYDKFEIIFVDDHSTDNSLDLIKRYSENRKNIKIIEATACGKKNALRQGVSESEGELIVCTDADCVVSKTWLETIAQFYSETKSDMIIAPVIMLPNKTAFQEMQALEFMSLQASTAGAACFGSPIMCNGANLAFKKETWNRNNIYLNDKKLSGDDMFLMESIRKNGGKISYLKSTQALVFTFPCKTLHEFLNQRKRWVSKSPAYKDIFIVLTALAVFGISVALITNLVLSIILLSSSYFFTFTLIFICKILFDRILLYNFSVFLKSQYLLKWVLPLSLIYPFYVIYSTFSGLLDSFEWKGRIE